MRLNNLAVYLYDEMGHYTDAEAAPAQPEEFHGARSWQKMTSLRPRRHEQSCCVVRAPAKNTPKAGPLFEQSLKIREDQLGLHHPEVALSLGHLGVWHVRMSQFAQAQAPLQRCLAIYDARLGRDHPHTARTLHNLAVSNASLKHWTTAVAYFDKSRKATARHLATVLPVLNEKELLAMLGPDYHVGFYKALSLGLAAKQEAGAASAEWLLNGKALAHQSLAEQQVLARHAGDTHAKKIIDDLQHTRTRLAATTSMSPPRPAAGECLSAIACGPENQGGRSDAGNLARAVEAGHSRARFLGPPR